MIKSTAFFLMMLSVGQCFASPTDGNAKIELGKMLFFDPRFSSTGTVSCNTCHNLMEGGDDSRSVSMGVHGKTGDRNAPTVWNATRHSVQFWDGRANTLEDQAKGPVVNPVEMGMSDLEQAMSRVRLLPGYHTRFEKAFGVNNPMTISNAAEAVAAFERTLVTPGNAYDQYQAGQQTAMTAQQIKGMQTFQRKGCTSCHSGSAFNGPNLPIGTGFYAKFPTFTQNDYVEKYQFMADKGRFKVTHKKVDEYLFRVPTLLNITDTAPYFHNGSVNDLEEAIRVMAKTQLNITLKEDEVKDIFAFLKALTGPYPEIVMPRLPSRAGSSIVGQ